MIPLSDWITSRRGELQASGSPLTGIIGGGASVDPHAGVETMLAESFERGRQHGVAEAGIAFEHRLEQDLAAAAVRLELLEAQWTDRCAGLTATLMKESLSGLMTAVERSFLEILLPFLDQAIVGRADGRLLELVDDELKRNGASVIEIRAPLRMHDALRSHLAASGVSATLSDGDPVVVFGRATAAVFEGLAQRWMEAIREGLA